MIPANSSAPTSGVLALRVLPSKSSVMPAIGAAPLSSCVGVAGLMCRKSALEPVVLRNGGSFAKRCRIPRRNSAGGEHAALYAAIVCAVLVPSE